MGIVGNMVKKTAKGFVVTTATAVAVSSISKVLKMSDSKVLNILGVGIPMMALVASGDPLISDNIFKASKQKDRKRDKSRKESEDDFFNIFGDKGHQMNKAIAEETGATEDEVNGVMSLFMPDFLDAVAEEDPKDSKALGKMLGDDAEEVKRESPSFTKMARRVIF